MHLAVAVVAGCIFFVYLKSSVSFHRKRQFKDSTKKNKTTTISSRRIVLQRGFVLCGTAGKPYFKPLSGIEKVHRNLIELRWTSGGEGGIRTLETLSRLHDFQSCALDQLGDFSRRYLISCDFSRARSLYYTSQKKSRGKCEIFYFLFCFLLSGKSTLR